MSISFIIPYYKIETNLLTRCIDSIQALGNIVDWEILVIDDGTPQSPAQNIVNAYKDKRITYTYIEHCGLGGARNKGILLSTKKYIQMVDSDDYLFLQQEKELIKIIKKEEPDALIFNYKKVYGTKPTSLFTTGHIIYKGDAIEYAINNDIPPSCCRYILKKASIGDLRFTPNLLHEDEEFTTLLFLRIKQILITDYQPYAYYQRENSIINSQNQETINQRFEDLLNIIYKIQYTIKHLNNNDPHIKVLSRKTHTLAMCFIVNLIRSVIISKNIDKNLLKLKLVGLYPLPHVNYGIRYSFIRFATFTTIQVKAINFIFQLFRNFSAILK